MAVTPFSDTMVRGDGVRRGMSPFSFGLIAVVLVLVAVYFAYSKQNPFANPYELNAIFNDANDIKQNSPVRIAGVEVGKVKQVESLESGKARVTMEIKEEGLPIREDAELKIRPRLFLEGNYFVDVHPGSPSAKEMESGETVPANRTASPVQFGEVLTALQRDTREDLQTFLREWSKGFDGRGGLGARGFNEAVEHWEAAYRDTSQVNEATLGRRKHDLSRLLRGQGKVFGALSKDEEALKDLVTNLNTTVAAFASQEDNLAAAIPNLRDVLTVGRPALQSLNRGLPSLKAFARDALPGARSSDEALTYQIPFVKQARRLFSEAELKGLVRDLRPTVPDLAALNRSQTKTFAETRQLSSCQNNVLLPFATTPIPDPDFPANSGQPWYKQSPRAFVGLAGESRIHDANSALFRVNAGGGPTTIASTGQTGEQYISQLDFPLDGVRPVSPEKKPPFRPDVPCETQEPPDLNAPSAAGDEPIDVNPVPSLPAAKSRRERMEREYKKLVEHRARVLKGLPSVDPIGMSDAGEKAAARKLGLRWMVDGKYLSESKRGRDR
jgi:phospholipid/cholesterol/gamma-HCH transport system substrate-binding protein